MLFQGSVAEAVSASKAGFKALVVLLAGTDNASREAERNLLAACSDNKDASVLLRLGDDLCNKDPTQFPDAKAFRQFCPTDALPTVAIVSPAGATLAILKGEQLTNPEALGSALEAAYQQVRQQAQALMAAQAFAALAQRAAAGGAQQGQQQAATGASQNLEPSHQQQQQQQPQQQEALEQSSQPESSEVAAVQEQPHASGGKQQQQQQQQEQGAQQDGQAAEQRKPGSQPARAGSRQSEGAGPSQAAAGAGDQAHSPVAEAPGLAPAVAPVPAAATPAESDGKLARSGPDAAGDPVAVPEGHVPAEPQVYTLQLRFTDGTPLKVDLQGTSQLAEVFAAADRHRAAQGKAAVPYVLVMPHPRRQFGPAEQLQTLQQLGIQPRTSLAVVPSREGHRPAGRAPAVPAAPAEAAGPGELAGSDVGASAGVGVGSSSREGLLVEVRLTNGDTLRQRFDGEATTLSQVLDYVDAHRTDGSKPYRLSAPGAPEPFSVGDLGRSLASLGTGAGRCLALCLLPLTPANKSGVSGSGTTGGLAKAAAPAPSAVFTLQFRQPDGKTLRGEFSPDSTLQELCHYIDARRTDGGGPYTLVQAYPRRRFAAGEEAEAEVLGKSLVQLGLDPRSLLIMEPQGSRAGGQPGSASGWGWSLGGALSTAASYLNPLAYMRPQFEPNPQLGDSIRRQQGQAGGDATDTGPPSEPAITWQEQGGGARKRSHSQAGGASGKVHTLDGPRSLAAGPPGAGQVPRGGGDDEDDRNVYWNGNSTEFGGDDRKDS